MIAYNAMRHALAIPLVLIAALAVAEEHHDQAPTDPFTLKPLSGNVALYGRGGNVLLRGSAPCRRRLSSGTRPGIVDKIRSVTPDKRSSTS